MRIVMAIAGILLSTPALIFFWIGSQTFLRTPERLLAVALTVETAALLALSVGLLFTPSLLRLQALLLGLTLASLVVVIILARVWK
jgi:hypothetical protein